MGDVEVEATHVGTTESEIKIQLGECCANKNEVITVALAIETSEEKCQALNFAHHFTRSSWKDSEFHVIR